MGCVRRRRAFIPSIASLAKRIIESIQTSDMGSAKNITPGFGDKFAKHLIAPTERCCPHAPSGSRNWEREASNHYLSENFRLRVSFASIVCQGALIRSNKYLLSADLSVEIMSALIQAPHFTLMCFRLVSNPLGNWIDVLDCGGGEPVIRE